MEIYTAEEPQPEREHGPDDRLFNVDGFSSDEIIVLARGIKTIADIGNQEGDPFSQMTMGDILFDRLVLDIHDLASRAPERAKDVVQRCAMSDIEEDRHFAARTAPALVGYDYGFTRDALVFLMVDHERRRLSWDDVFDTAKYEIYTLMRDKLTPQQSDDFRARLAFYGSDVPAELTKSYDT